MARRRSTTTPDPVLDAAAEAAREETRAAARKFELAVTWAETHPAPVEEAVVDDLGTLVMYGDQPATLAGEGAPGMSEFAISEFAAAVGMTPYGGRAFIGAALEAKYRLPKIWTRVLAGEVPVWKARRVTHHTHRLTPAGAAYVDTELAPILHSCSYGQIEKAVAAAAAEADTEYEEQGRVEDHDTLPRFDLWFDAAHLNHGLVPIDGLLDYTDALALDAALKAKAEEIRAEHPELSLDLRRARAAGQLGTSDTAVTREVVVYAHFNPTDDHGIVDLEGLERLGHTTIEQITDWCTRAGTKVTVRPVLDLDTEIHVDRYRPSEQLREQVILTCPTCVYPGCGRSARTCDLDHITPYRQGGQTSSWNLAPLCRLHHRMKTHGYWTYTRLSRTEFHWTSTVTDNRTYYVDLTHKRRRTR